MGELTGEVSRRISIVFVDVDGTLLGSSQQVSRENIAALSACRAAGVRVVLASGRPPKAIALLARYVPIEDIAVCLNGGIVVDLRTEQVLFRSELSQELVSCIVSVADGTGALPCIYTAFEWFVRLVDEQAVSEIKRSGIKPVITSDFTLIEGPIIKVLIIANPSTLQRAEKMLRGTLDSSLHISYSYPEYLEVTGKAATKAAACEEVLKTFGLGWNVSMAIGDSTNDIALVDRARIGVAMSNSWPELMAVANYRTASSDQDGVAIAIRGLVLGDVEAYTSLVKLT